MADRYWVGGAGTWNATNTTNWSATSGGAGGASVPTSADNVFFNGSSGAGTVTIGASVNSLSLDCTGFTGTLSGSNLLNVYGSLTLATSMTYSATGTVFFLATSGSWTVNAAGKTLGAVNFQTGASAASWTLSAALASSGSLSVTGGTLNTAGFAVTATSLWSGGTNTRAISLGASTVTLSSGTPLSLATTGLTFNAGTSQINCSSASWTLNGLGLTFNNISFTSTAQTSGAITGENTFSNLTIAGRLAAGINSVSLAADQTITSTLTLPAGTNATARTFLRSDVVGTTRTLTCNAVAALTDADFRDIAVAGAAVAGGPLTGTRLGDCKGNAGITFPAPKTVYWGQTAAGNWGGGNWNTTDATGGSVANFPLAQDTAVFGTRPNSGITIAVNAAYNIGTVDMSARTTSTMTLATGTQIPTIYGNWINGTGSTLTGTGTLTFAGRGAQTITSAGKTFTQPVSVNSPGGALTLADAFATSSASGIYLNSGELDANIYNVTTPLFTTQTSNNARTVKLGSGTWTLTGSSAAWLTNNPGTLTVTGTGTISMTSASAKTFQGSGIQTYPTLNQGGTGTLSISGSNKFANITNTAIGTVLFAGGSTNEFGDFNLNGTSTAARLTVGSTNTTQAILKKPGAWNVGSGSLDGGNNTGLSFI